MPNDDKDMPCFIIGDDAFVLRTWMMKPFSIRSLSREERIFNYRLSRARRIVENAFGILANRFQCLLGTMRQELHRVHTIAFGCCTLHNLIRLRYPAGQNAIMDREDAGHNIIPGEWRDGLDLPDLRVDDGRNTGPKAAQIQRQYLKEY